MAPRRPTPAQIRERRARIAAIGLGVVFLGVAVMQGPKLYKTINGKSESVSIGSETTSAATTAPSASVSFTQVSSSTGASGQLARFSLLALKDPFRSQAQTTATTTTPATTTTAAATPTTTTPATPPATTTTPTTTTTMTTVPTPATPPSEQPPVPASSPATAVTAGAAAAGTEVAAADVRMNGRRLLIAEGGKFPVRAPLFKLVSLGKKGLWIRLVGGSFSDGSRTMRLRKGWLVTLLDRTDGTSFKIRFVQLAKVAPERVTIQAPVPAAAGSPAGTATTPSQPAPKAG